MLDDAIQNTVAMLPPSPANSLLEFLEGVVLGEIEPAMCSPEVRIDAQRYWEMRRVQNSVRRVLESLQEILGLEADLAATELGTLTWDVMFAASAGTAGNLDEYAFVSALDAFGAWPPEMSPADRCEVFAALRVPCCAAIRALNTGQPLAKELSRRMLCEGLARVPFNIPDFPVPSHLVHQSIAGGRGAAGSHEAVDDLAEHIASAFCMEQTGLDRVKDFFLCGLLSLEEIQVALPHLASDALVEEAVVRVIRTGSRHFTQREWQTLVISVRMGPAPSPEAIEEAMLAEQQYVQVQAQAQAEMEALAAQQSAAALSPAPAHQQLQTQGSTGAFSFPGSNEPPQRSAPTPPPVHREVAASDAAHHDILPALISPGPTYRQVAAKASPIAEEHSPPESRSVDPPDLRSQEPLELSRLPRHSAPSHLVTMTEPLPNREVRSVLEEPVKFHDHTWWASGNLERIINWNTTQWGYDHGTGDPGSVDLTGDGHQADEGAGTRAPAEQAVSGLAGLGRAREERADDPVRLIGLGMHNECLGPFLAQAFVRCCQLYDSRRED